MIIGYLLLSIVFIATRLWIWNNPPLFSDVMYAYADYARMWHEGYTPYLKHLFEYPPANIILFYLPKILDLNNILDYRTSYRLILFLVDLAIFILAIFTLNKLKLKNSLKFIALLYYLLTIAKAKDFVYDEMDLMFIFWLFLSFVFLKLKKQTTKTIFFSWVFFWLSTAFKYITFPLAIPYLLMKKNINFKREILVAGLSFLVVWGLPLAIFRSSLSVSLYYHLRRGFQVESVPANIIRLINSWTKSETYVEVYKNYDIVGPLTLKLTPYLSLMFPITMIGFVVYSVKKSLLLAKNLKDEYKEKIRLYLIFIYLFLLTSKVFSTPFHLCIPPLLTIYPFKSVKKQLPILLISFFMLAISMTLIPNTKFSIFDVHTAIGIARPICLLTMLFLIIKT